MKTRCLAVLSGAILLFPDVLPAQDESGNLPRRRIVLPPAPGNQGASKATPDGPVKRRVVLGPAGGAEKEVREEEAEAAGKEGGGERLEIFMENATLDDMLAPLYAEIAGCQVVVHEKIARAVVTVRTQGDVPLTEAIVFCETALLAQGIALVEAEAGTVIMLPFEEAGGNPDYAPPVVRERVELPPGERIVDFVVAARGLDVEKLREFFGARLKAKPFTRIDAAPDGKSILVRETAATVRRMLELLDALETEAEPEKP